MSATLWVGTVIAILWFAAALHQRLERVEGRLRTFLWELQKRLVNERNRVLAPEELAERIADSLARASSALESVVLLTLWMTPGFMREIGLTDAEVGELRNLFSAGRFEVWRKLERWTTHTVVFDDKDFKKNVVRYLSTSYGSSWPVALWSYRFDAHAEERPAYVPVDSRCSELVLDDNRIKYCMEARWPAPLEWPFKPTEKNTFICIPSLGDGDLDQHRFAEEYSHTDPRGFGWTIRVDRGFHKG